MKKDNVHEQNTQKQGVELITYNSDNRLYKEKIKSSPKRVIAIWQTSVETLIALGQSDKIIAAIGLPDDKCLKESYRDAYQRIPYKSFNRLNVTVNDFKGINTAVAYRSNQLHTRYNELKNYINSIDEDKYVADIINIRWDFDINKNPDGSDKTQESVKAENKNAAATE